jgi:pimeloyl-ACP methyl ester carboxylesterase
MAAYLEFLPASAQAALAMPVPPQVPVTILSAANATGAELEERGRWAHESGDGRHIRLERSGHWVQLEQPEVVVETVRQAIESARLK